MICAFDQVHLLPAGRAHVGDVLSRQGTDRRHSFDLRDHLGAEALDRLQRKLRIHARPIDHEPHDVGAELSVILHDLSAGRAVAAAAAESSRRPDENTYREK